MQAKRGGGVSEGRGKEGEEGMMKVVRKETIERGRGDIVVGGNRRVNGYFTVFV